MIDDVNENSKSKISELEKKGYRYLPMKNLIEEKSKLLYDTRTKLYYETFCNYTGQNLNLYNEGSEKEWIDLYKTFNPSWNKTWAEGQVRSDRVI
jgi:hypothetical protein